MKDRRWLQKRLIKCIKIITGLNQKSYNIFKNLIRVSQCHLFTINRKEYFYLQNKAFLFFR